MSFEIAFSIVRKHVNHGNGFGTEAVSDKRAAKTGSGNYKANGLHDRLSAACSQGRHSACFALGCICQHHRTGR